MVVDHLSSMRMSCSRAFIVCLGFLLLTGCTRQVNARLELGALDRTGTFDSASDPAGINPGTPRSGWDTTIIIAPIDGIAHGPTIRLYAAPRNTDHPRTYGLLPTADSALDHQTHSPIASFRYTRSELVATMASIIDPFRIHSGLTNRHWSPTRVWKRSRQDNIWSSGRSSRRAQEHSDE